MTRKTQEEINYWFQDNTVKSALDLTLIEKKLYINNLDIPNNIVIHKNGNTFEDFVQWYYNETKFSKYPTTYEECKALLHGTRCGYDWRLIRYFQQLLLCRDAYWKIAGEELGLGKPWEPDWSESKPKYTIVVIENKLVKHYALTQSYILVFPTAEMRDAFYENFKDQIDSCKTLL